METSMPEEDELAKARLLVQKAEEERRAACAAELEAVLKKYGFILRVTEPQIILVEKPNT